MSSDGCQPLGQGVSTYLTYLPGSMSTGYSGRNLNDSDGRKAQPVDAGSISHIVYQPGMLADGVEGIYSKPWRSSGKDMTASRAPTGAKSGDRVGTWHGAAPTGRGVEGFREKEYRGVDTRPREILLSSGVRMPIVAAKVSNAGEAESAHQMGYAHLHMESAVADTDILAKGLFSSCCVSRAAQLKGKVDLCCMDISPDDTQEVIQARWSEMEALVDGGQCAALGVAKATEQQLASLLAECKIKPEVYVGTFHPLKSQRRLLGFCRRKGLAAMAGELGVDVASTPESEVVARICKACERSPLEVHAKWILQRGVGMLLTEAERSSMASAEQVWEFSLSDLDKEALDTLSK
mmetsp:Transcript_8227/g.30346  ORF Transcript_8227/g.30346 Transcript_8227/m.30346 type:complete len:350 (-) Transcript_8227:117-1166(-)|eukprot:scaffold1167_cov418-Prasinococcus_capsulatus_cf.AAC.32